MSIPFFEDFGKATKDGLKKNFPSGKKVVMKTTAESGTKTEAMFVKKGDTFAPHLQVSSYCSKLQADVSLSMCACNPGTLKVVKDELMKGLKTTVEVSPCQGSGSVGLDYKHEHVSIKDSVKCTDKGTVSALSMAFGRNGKFGGFGVTYNLSEMAFVDAAVGAQLSKGRYSVAWEMRRCMGAKDCVASATRVHYAASDKSSVFVEGVVSGTGMSFAADSVDVAVGSACKVDASTMVHTKFSRSGRMDLGVKFDVNKCTSVAVGAFADFGASEFGMDGLELSLSL